MSYKNFFEGKNIKNSILYTLFSFINNGLSFVLVLVLAHFLLPSDYGKLNLFNTCVTLFSIFICLGATPYVANCFFSNGRGELWKIISVILLISTSVFVLLITILLAFPIQFCRISGIEIQYIFICLLICYCQTISNMNLDIWRLEERPIIYGIYSLSYAFANVLLTLILIAGLKYGWNARAYAQGCVAFIYLIFSIYFLRKRGYLKVKFPQLALIKETLIFALPLLPHMISFWIKQGLDRYFINYFYDSSAVGLYSFALNFGSVIAIVGTAFNSNNSVFIYKKLSTGIRESIPVLFKQSKLMTIAFFVVSVIVVFFAYLLIPIIIPKYNPSIVYILPICVGAFFQCLYLLWVNYLFYFKKTKQLMYITFTTSIIQALLSYIFTRYNVLYTAYVSMIIAIITFVSVYWFAKYKLLMKDYNVNL